MLLIDRNLSGKQINELESFGNFLIITINNCFQIEIELNRTSFFTLITIIIMNKKKPFKTPKNQKIS